MRVLLTFLIMAAFGAVLAIGAQIAAVPASASFGLGMAYVIGISMLLNTRGARA